MKAYVIFAGVVFALLTVAHVWRIVFETPILRTDPFFASVTVFAAAMALWALRVVRGERAGR